MGVESGLQTCRWGMGACGVSGHALDRRLFLWPLNSVIFVLNVSKSLHTASKIFVALPCMPVQSCFERLPASRPRLLHHHL